MNVEDIKAKYGVQQADAFGQPASEVIGIANLKAQAQKAVDVLWDACRKARSAVSEYNKKLAKSGQPEKQVFFLDILNNLKSGSNTRI